MCRGGGGVTAVKGPTKPCDELQMHHRGWIVLPTCIPPEATIEESEYMYGSASAVAENQLCYAITARSERWHSAATTANSDVTRLIRVECLEDQALVPID